MGRILVLTEKPSVAREIGKVLGCNQKGNGCLIGKQYIITWALGHLVTLAGPEEYNKRYKTWNLEDLPMLPKSMKLIVIKQTAKQFNAVKELMRKKDIDELIIATDSGREGELVARWIIQKAEFKKPIKRLWISSQTHKAIKEGFSNLKSSKEYDRLYKSAQCRAEADWLIGLNVTRALTCKYNAQLSAGRVQTPTLAMVVQRENEIKKFIPKDYWTIEATVNNFKIHWEDKVNRQTRIFNKLQADKIVSNMSGSQAIVVDVKKEAKKEYPPMAYDLTELQRDANRKYGYSAKKTLSIMQRLYETHKLLTYPRTDSRYITDDIVPTLVERLKSISVGPYSSLVQTVLKNKLQITKRLVDNSKVTDHHAIIPTEQYLDLNSLNSDERNIYDLVVRNFIAVLSFPSEYELTTIKLDVNGEVFTAKGKIIKSKGWNFIYENEKHTNLDEDNKEQVLTDVKKGDTLKVISPKAIAKKTTPPARYTEATLLSAMEHPGKFIENKALRETIESTSGLGTPATRADIIEKLFDSFYMERIGKEIVPTSKGIQIINLVPEELKSPELTAKWESKLQLISKGKASSDNFIAEMKNYATKLVAGVMEDTATYRHDNMTREKCPECGKYLLDVKGKKGKMLVCPERVCGYRKGISQTSNARCPQCHKKMEIRGEAENKTFFCACGHREKLESFKKRKGEKVNKKEVRKILKNQEPKEEINSALAEALSKWNKE